MNNSSAKGPFPDYVDPPVVETILGVQFDPLASWRNAHLGVFWKTLNTDDWPNVSDAPPLQPQFERFAAAGGLAATAALLTAGLFEYNFGDSEVLMLFLILVTIPAAAQREPAPLA